MDEVPTVTELHSATRCTGHCCHRIRLNDGIARRTVQTWAHEAFEKDENSAHGIECAKIAEMLVPLVGDVPHRTKGKILGPDGKIEHDPHYAHADDHLYTCRYFDGTNCTNYDERPNLCRSYPYGKECEQPECTWAPAEASTLSALLDAKHRWERDAKWRERTGIREPCSSGLIAIGPKLKLASWPHPLCFVELNAAMVVAPEEVSPWLPIPMPA